MYQPKYRRRRGVILTPQGSSKLQKAKSEAEFKENCGYRYTLEKLSDRTGLAVDTLLRVNNGSTTVDKQTLKRYFRAFNLILEQSDYSWPETQIKEVEPDRVDVKPELPGGQVPLDSAFYVERPPIESRTCEAILQPGALIRIKAPQLMGKTSLMARILERGRKEGYQTVVLNLKLADEKVFTNLNRFLQWFCACVSRSLKLPNKLADYWDEMFGSNYNTTDYFENYSVSRCYEVQ
ncbi:AAA-like domain-containing protein [Microcoleus sp. T3_A4]|uniref:AAA-like domain-containing protein n=1 Tax=Microcoleus sp. T3_A4 TaxID=2818968 RepID=UPI002FD35FEF